MRFWTASFCAAAVAGLSACAGSSNSGTSYTPLAAPLSSSLVTTDKGQVQGVNSGGVRSFLGIPFAAAPTGPLRFAAPQPHAAWTTTLNATVAGTPCPQNGQTTISEDCLNLNVFTPAAGSGPLPVYVFIYGGGFSGGSNISYDASKLAATGIVVVVPNYRVGILGWFASAALDDGNGDTGDYGI
jgi:para-nitrobenzyl esterase